MHIINSVGIAYHQNEVLHIIIAKALYTLRVMIYTFGDDIQPAADDIPLLAQWIKITKQKLSYFPYLTRTEHLWEAFHSWRGRNICGKFADGGWICKYLRFVLVGNDDHIVPLFGEGNFPLYAFDVCGRWMGCVKVRIRCLRNDVVIVPYLTKTKHCTNRPLPDETFFLLSHTLVFCEP